MELLRLYSKSAPGRRITLYHRHWRRAEKRPGMQQGRILVRELGGGMKVCVVLTHKW